MYEHIIESMSAHQKIEAAGFKPHLDELVVKLHSCGYAEHSVSLYEQGTVHFAFWLIRQHIGPSNVNEGHIKSFLSRHLARCHCPVGGIRDLKSVRAALMHFKAVLKDAGYLRSLPKEVPDAIDIEVRRFDDYLRLTAGLQESTRIQRRRYVREFLQKFFGDKTVDLFRLAPKDVIRYVSKRASSLTPASAKPLASSLRSYFRFLRLHGQCEEALTFAVPTSARRRLASLPRVLTDDEIKRLLAAFSRKTVMGRRDYAIARCLIDLGLRAGEVARLRLDDIDWRKGKLRIVGAKSRREDELPLPAAVAESIADFVLRGRPETPERQVFVRLRPPIGQPFNRNLVRGVIHRAAARAGLESIVTGTQILRHTAASRMLRHGASIKEVADVLRHRSLDTTAIYTKVDLPRLATVAMEWPKEENL